MNVRKAVITAAGWGTRFLPATKAQPKEMLPLLSKPLIQYAVEEAVASGIEQIIIVTALGKHTVEDHFDRCYELEHVLARKGQRRVLAEVRSIGDSVDICYVRQREQRGLGHAVLTAERLVGEEPFALILPDDVIAAQLPATRQIIGAFEKRQSCIVALEEVPEDRISDYGIVKPEWVEKNECKLLDLVEKPKPASAPSNLGVVGRYVLTPDIFPALRRTQPGQGGEVQLTDGLKALLKERDLYGYRFEGVRHDTGTPLGLLKASISYALADPVVGPGLREYLAGLGLALDRPRKPKLHR